jgi:hypothetical protein
MENNAYFVNSRGILKSCDFHSQNPCSSWGYDTDYLNKMIGEICNMFDGMSIYVCTDALPYFFYEILPKINNTFYLVSGDSDATVPNGGIDIYRNPRALEENICLEILNHPKLIQWFSQNCIFTNENVNTTTEKVYNVLTNSKICQLPIGLDYHTISNDPDKFWRDKNEGYSVKYQEHILKKIRQTMKPFYERTHKIFVNMSIGDETCVRRKAINQIPSELLVINADKMSRTRVWNEITNYTFALSPYGSGPDCHRHWEILCLGCIPIIRSFGSNQMFEDLPVLIVNEWSDINEQLLEDTLNKFKKTNFNYNKLSLQYWVDKFSSPPSFL